MNPHCVNGICNKSNGGAPLRQSFTSSTFALSFSTGCPGSPAKYGNGQAVITTETFDFKAAIVACHGKAYQWWIFLSSTVIVAAATGCLAMYHTPGPWRFRFFVQTRSSMEEQNSKQQLVSFSHSYFFSATKIFLSGLCRGLKGVGLLLIKVNKLVGSPLSIGSAIDLGTVPGFFFPSIHHQLYFPFHRYLKPRIKLHNQFCLCRGLFFRL